MVLGLVFSLNSPGLKLFAQAPDRISYQAAVRNSSDLLIVSQPIGMRISIIQGIPTGIVVFSETHLATTTPNGIVSVVIGGGTLVSGDISAIDWEAGPYYIKTETDPAGGTTYTISGTTELISVPYAFWAPTAGNTFSGDYNDLINKPKTDGSETVINGGTFVTVSGSGTTASPYVISSNPVMGGYSHYLGEFYNGGIIFHLYKRSDGTERALIVSLTESTPIALQNPQVNVDAESVWDGAGNTALYTNSPAVTYATSLGYGWYLPAIDELNILWQNRFHVARGLAAVGGTPLSMAWYWSSTENASSSTLGWQFSFQTAAARSTQGKASIEIVRAIRGLITAPDQITTNAVTDVTNVAATSGGNIISDEGTPVTARGVCWSTSPNPTTADSKTVDGSGIGSYSSSITGLIINTTYYVRAYATNGAGTAYGNERSFTTAATAPVVTTTAASGLTKTTASSGGNVTDERGDPVTARGVCWSTSPNPTLSDSFTTDGTGGGVFTSSITGLVTGTLYYARAYATNGVGTSYGNQVSFTTLAIPTVVTGTTTYVIGGLATSAGTVTNEGGVSVTSRGVCWNTTGSPTIADSFTTDGSGPGAFTSNIAGLTVGLTYYVRAYASSGEGTGYGNEVTIFSLALGDLYQEGRVAYIDGSGQHGFIVSNGDLSAGSAWSNITNAYATAYSVTDGPDNTSLIVGQAGHVNSAAKICDDYDSGVYDDWYLPALNEWATLNTNRANVGIGDNINYWTSTEWFGGMPGSNAYRYRTATGSAIMGKVSSYRVRAIRIF